MTNKELEKKVEELERIIKKYFETPVKGERKFDISDYSLNSCYPFNQLLTIDDIEVGQQFKYCGHTYTKLNEENFCIIDDFDSDFMYCVFDPITTNYDESIIRQYINSDRFIERLGVNKDDIKPRYKEDLITLLSKEEYEEYRDLIQDYDGWWATRSAYSNDANCFCYICSTGGITSNLVYGSIRARIGFNLNPNTPVDRKGNNEEEMGDDEEEMGDDEE